MSASTPDSRRTSRPATPNGAPAHLGSMHQPVTGTGHTRVGHRQICSRSATPTHATFGLHPTRRSRQRRGASRHGGGRGADDRGVGRARPIGGARTGRAPAGLTMCLGATQRGEPRHPLYVAEDTPLVPWLPAHSAPAPEDEKLRGHAAAGHPGGARTALSRPQDPEDAAPRLTHPSSPGHRVRDRVTADPLVAVAPEYDARRLRTHRRADRRQRPTRVRLDELGRLRRYPAVPAWQAPGRRRNAIGHHHRARRTVQRRDHRESRRRTAAW